MPDIFQKCGVTGSEFVITEWEQNFLNRMNVPYPTLSSRERLKQRLSHRNERSIYKDICDLTGKSIISIYSPDKSFIVYSQEAWWSDSWDSRVYGRDFDFSRSFFDQFYELRKAVPRLALMNVRSENSEYCNITNSDKNCYLVFGGDFCEDCMYSIFSMYCKDTMDVYWVNKSEMTYDCIDCTQCYNIKYCQYSHRCRDSVFLFECRSCENCAFSVGLRNKQYHIFNKPYSKEEYFKKMRTFRFDSWNEVQKMKNEFDTFRLQFPHLYAHILNCENVTGDNIVNAKNCFNCFDIEGPAQDFKDVFLGGYNASDCLSCDHVGFKSQLFYEMVGSIEGYNCAFCTFSWNSKNTWYCDMVANCHDLFGCSSMHNASYCILNKQYSEGEYFDLRARIIEHMKKNQEWGEFFPMKQSLFAYNETVAQDYFPLDRDEAVSQGLFWYTDAEEVSTISQNISDSIHDVSDDILLKTLICEKTGKPYKIIPQELKFYRRFSIPIPRFAPETRHRLRIALRHPIGTFSRRCAQCGGEIETSYSPNRPEKVYCEPCYLKEVY